MRPWIRVLLLIVLVTGCTPEPDEIVLRGRVTGANGSSMPTARVAIRGMDHRDSRFANDDGSWEFRIPRTGAYFITVSGPFHRSMFRPVYVDAFGEVELDIQLATTLYEDPIDTVRVIGAFNEWDDDDGELPMIRGDDGLFRLTLAAPADTFAYQLMGVQYDDYQLPGTQWDRWARTTEYPTVANHAGTFVSVVEAPEDSVEIVFDPALLPRSELLAEVRFGDPDSRTARVDRLHRHIQGYRDELNAMIDAQRAAGEDVDFMAYDWDAAKSEVVDLLEAEEDSVIQQFLLLSYFEHLLPNEADSLMARRSFEDVPPASTLWSLVWGIPTNTLHRLKMVSGQPERADAYAMDVVELNPDSTVKASFLAYEVGVKFTEMNEEKQRLIETESGIGPATREFSILFDKLMSEFGDTFDAQRAKQRYAPNRAIQSGKESPPITAWNLADTSRAFDPSSIRGKVTLIEFWAIWCGPCIGEMQYLHDAYEKYHDQGFEIVSVSFDENPRDVHAFREGDWPMPWTHVWVKEGFQSRLAEDFEVAGIPKPILVDENGNIIASEQELRREKLDEMLAAVFENRAVAGSE